MIIHKCDRCGAEIVSRNKTLGELVNDLFGEQKPDFKISNCSTSFPTYLDLCEDCQKSFNEWFASKRGDQK